MHPAGTFIYVTTFDATVAVISTATNTVTATVPLDGSFNLRGIALHPAGTFVYVVNNSNATVAVINTATNTVTSTVPVGAFPVGVAVHPMGTFVYVANSTDNTVTVINTATNAPIATIPVGESPQGVAVHPAGTFAYVANQTDNTVSVLNTATNTVTATLAVGAAPVAFGPFIGPQSPGLTAPVCSIQLNQTSFITGNQVIAQVLQIANPATTPLPIEFKFWFEVPGTGRVRFASGGLDGSVVLPAKFSQNLGPLPLLTVTSAFPRGNYSFHCAFEDPVGYGVLANHFVPFTIK